MAQENLGIPVLMYHQITSNEADQYKVTVGAFTAQMKWLSDNGYKTITGAQLTGIMTGAIKRPPGRLIVITLDDGWKDQLNALSVLDRYKYKAVFAIIAGVPGADPQYLSWDDIRMIAAAGHEIASHSYTHDDDAVKASSIVASNYVIERELKKRPLAIVWPYGKFDAKSVAIAKSEGFTSAYMAWFNGGSPWATVGGDVFSIPRILVDGRCDLPFFAKSVEHGQLDATLCPIRNQ